jgi:hypothetical protein
MQRLPAKTYSPLPGAKSTKILSSLWNYVRKQLDDDAASGVPVNRHVEVDFGVAGINFRTPTAHERWIFFVSSQKRVLELAAGNKRST